MKRELLEELVEDHGELHVVVEEHDAVTNDPDEDYIGIRDNTHYKFGETCFQIMSGNEKHYVPYDRVVYAYTPTEFPD